MIQYLDLFGTFIFAVSGGFRAVKYELDILGVLLLAISTGVGGGIIRDMILGSTPPSAFQNEEYLIICIAAGLLVFFIAPKIATQWKKIILSDALGLGVFTAIGASKAVAFGMGPVGVVMMGVLTATGGGVIRDIMVREMPSIIEKDFYASASILGAIFFLIADFSGLHQHAVITITILSTTIIRLYAMTKKINLPKVKKLPVSPSQLAEKNKK